MSQIVVSIEAIPPRENSASIVSLPVVDTKPVAIAAKIASMPIRTGPWSGLSTNVGDELAAA